MNLRERLGELNSSEGEEEKDAVEMVGPPTPECITKSRVGGKGKRFKQKKT
jgi:hypothetical protein